MCSTFVDRSRSTRCEPIKPAPPVISRFFICGSSFCSINPQVPAPSGGHLRLERPRKNWAEHWQPTLVQEIGAQFDVCEIVEEFACFVAGVDSSEGVAGAICVAAQEFFGAQIVGLCLQLSRVFTKCVCWFAGQEMHEFYTCVPAQEVYACAPQQ